MKYIKIISSIFVLTLLLLGGYQLVVVNQAKAATEAIFARALSEDNITLELSDLSNQQKASLLAIEDPNFYQHSGVDFTTPGAGLTTITQGIVKYLYFDQFSPGFKKIEQTLIAWLAVTPQISKDDQLTVFINSAYLGTVEQEAVRGFAKAAEVYYKKSWRELSDEEYLSLFAMLVAPDAYSIKYQPERNKNRVQRIKKLLNGQYQPTGLLDVFYDQDN